MLTSFSDIPASDVLLYEVYRAPIRTSKTCDCLHQLILAVSCYSGDSQDFTSPHGEIDTPDLLLAAVRFDPQILNREHWFCWVRYATIYRELNFAPDHERGKIIL